MQARVVELVGSVQYAVGDADPLDENAWKPVDMGMRFGAGTHIRTGLRARCILMFGEEPNETVISIRRATSARILDFYRTENEQRVRVGLGYGAIRGGSTEGTLRSDVIIDSTVATLAKRGTEGFEIEVEPVTGYYRVSLARSGLVDALTVDPPIQRQLKPGEYVSSDMVATLWITQAKFDRTVRFFDIASASRDDVLFMTDQTTGFASIGPGVGSAAPSFAGRGRGGLSVFGPSPNDPVNVATRIGLTTLLISRSPTRRPEGDFGFAPTFRVMAPRADAFKLRGIRSGLSAARSRLRSNVSR